MIELKACFLTLIFLAVLNTFNFREAIEDIAPFVQVTAFTAVAVNNSLQIMQWVQKNKRRR